MLTGAQATGTADTHPTKQKAGEEDRSWQPCPRLVLVPDLSCDWCGSTSSGARGLHKCDACSRAGCIGCFNAHRCSGSSAVHALSCADEVAGGSPPKQRQQASIAQCQGQSVDVCCSGGGAVSCSVVVEAACWSGASAASCSGVVDDPLLPGAEGATTGGPSCEKLVVADLALFVPEAGPTAYPLVSENSGSNGAAIHTHCFSHAICGNALVRKLPGEMLALR